MIDGIFPYFVDELIKQSVQLAKKEKAQLYGQYAALGALSYPSVIALANKMEKGHAIPVGTSPKRWLAAQVLKGVAGGAAIPAIRLHMVRRMEDKARERLLNAKTKKAGLPW